MKPLTRGRPQAAVRPPRAAAHRVRQGVAVTLMVLGLVAGAFAVPALAAEGDAVDQVSTLADPVADPPADTPGDPGDPGGGGGGGGGGLDDPCTILDLGVDKEPGIDGCQPLPCDNPNATNCPDVVEPCTDGVDYNGADQDGCGEAPDNGGGTDPTPPTVVPCTSGVDYNGPTQDGCGQAPDNGGGTGGGGTGGGGTGGGTGGGGTGGGTGGGSTGGGTGGGSTGGGSTGGGTTGSPSSGGGLGTVSATPEGTVPGGEAAAPVSACADTVICQSAPAAATTTSSTDGLPDTGAPADAQGLLVLGLGLLAAGAYVSRPRRRGGRHRLVSA